MLLPFLLESFPVSDGLAERMLAFWVWHAVRPLLCLHLLDVPRILQQWNTCISVRCRIMGLVPKKKGLFRSCSSEMMCESPSALLVQSRNGFDTATSKARPAAVCKLHDDESCACKTF